MRTGAVILLIIGLCSCERIYYFPDKPLIGSQTVIIAHKGGGFFDDGNTFEGCMYGLVNFEGIEVDLQKGADNVLWLSHSPYAYNCDSSQACFSLLSSEKIAMMDSCAGKSKDFTRLEEIFKYVNEHCPGKYISLDVKAWKPCSPYGINITREMNLLAQEIIDLTTKYHMEGRVMVESETGDFLYYIKIRTKNIETYQAVFGDFEMGISRALHAGFTGVSFQYKFKEEITKEQVDLIHRKGLKIQLWTISDEAVLKEALSLNPDFIQSDVLVPVNGPGR